MATTGTIDTRVGVRDWKAGAKLFKRVESDPSVLDTLSDDDKVFLWEWSVYHLPREKKAQYGVPTITEWEAWKAKNPDYKPRYDGPAWRGVGGAIARNLLYNISSGLVDPPGEESTTAERVAGNLAALVGLGIGFVPYARMAGWGLKGLGAAAKLRPLAFGAVREGLPASAQFMVERAAHSGRHDEPFFSFSTIPHVGAAGVLGGIVGALAARGQLRQAIKLLSEPGDVVIDGRTIPKAQLIHELLTLARLRNPNIDGTPLRELWSTGPRGETTRRTEKLIEKAGMPSLRSASGTPGTVEQLLPLLEAVERAKAVPKEGRLGVLQRSRPLTEKEIQAKEALFREAEQIGLGVRGSPAERGPSTAGNVAQAPSPPRPQTGQAASPPPQQAAEGPRHPTLSQLQRRAAAAAPAEPTGPYKLHEAIPHTLSDRTRSLAEKMVTTLSHLDLAQKKKGTTPEVLNALRERSAKRIRAFIDAYNDELRARGRGRIPDEESRYMSEVGRIYRDLVRKAPVKPTTVVPKKTEEIVIRGD